MEFLNLDLDSSTPLCHESGDNLNSVETQELEEIGVNGKNQSHDRETSRNLFIGKIVKSENEAYDLYLNYAHTLGFSVRIHKQSFTGKPPRLWKKEYVCSKNGFKNNKRSSDEASKKNDGRTCCDGRTGCEAMITWEIDKEGLWTVSRFVEEHNLGLATPEEMHLLRSARKIPKEKGNTLLSMVKTGIRTIDAYNYMAKESGGEHMLGFVKKDGYNYINSQKLMSIEGGDAQSLVNYFKSKTEEEGGMFYWDVQVDQEGRITIFFWRDGRSRTDYDCFGDVMVFDSTYRTNRYGLVCAPFVGVNHHWKNIMYGCAFLSDETTSSFEWLFSTFLQSMGNKAPKTIFTDQDQTMAKAIKKKFPTTSHRLCLWHIAQNAPSHLGKLNNNQDFRKLFDKCMKKCESEEFEETWEEMMSKYNLKDHKWLLKLYNIRKRCAALNKDNFNGGIKSSQRSESTNNALNGIASKTTSLTNFVLGFDNIVRT